MAEAQRPRPARRFIRQSSSRSLITYGKKTTPLLSLTASHFLSSVSDLRLDEDHGEIVSPKRTRPVSPIRDRESSQDSVLSDAEPLPEQVRNDVARRRLDRPSPVGIHTETPSNSRDLTEARPQEHGSRVETPSAPAPVRRRTSATKTTKKVPRNSEAAPRKGSTIQRRLPVNELFLVPSTVDYTCGNTRSRSSSSLGIDIQDPIVDRSSSPNKAYVSPGISRSGGTLSNRPRDSLSTIKSRLKRPPSIFKQIDRVKPDRWHRKVLRGDGFDNSELRIVDIPRPRRRPKPNSPSMLAFAELQLTSGPLPDITFQPSADQLEVGVEHNDATPPVMDYTPQSVVDNAFPRSMSRAVPTQSSILKAQQIMAQLSCITAPARPRSESGGSERYTDEEEVDEEDEEEDVEKEIYPHTADGPAEYPLESPRPINRADRSRGVLMDFRQPARPDLIVRKPRRLAIMEINEPIIEVPNSSMPQAPRILGNVPASADVFDPILESSGQSISGTRDRYKANSTQHLPHGVERARFSRSEPQIYSTRRLGRSRQQPTRGGIV